MVVSHRSECSVCQEFTIRENTFLWKRSLYLFSNVILSRYVSGFLFISSCFVRSPLKCFLLFVKQWIIIGYSCPLPKGLLFPAHDLALPWSKAGGKWGTGPPALASTQPGPSCPCRCSHGGSVPVSGARCLQGLAGTESSLGSCRRL